ncbi:DUF1638 domain-containing protein [Clostridium formicaceticum]|uniref:DUF1638 domain-containing protein n=1 Tax=Clostridium formicaceticum TaxID=1497 RepID=A0AAC9RQ09_9CLOT|nr:DUF1638 domain-containing protein [Clostridium formicaceticum]AOY74760.1 hypothetical protein BJL90_01595 [Clostridium formicaceticum]ARE89148.1 hypothetical protein CLFO_35540 [Clostridium formicaceticum]
MSTLIVACQTIADELNVAIKETNCNYPVLWIESGLHMVPDSLKKRLQDELDHISNVDRVLMAFGFCGNSLLGVTAPSYPIIFPRIDDCITLLLGSCKKRKEICDEMGTYFLTKGWLTYEKNIWAEYQDTVKRMGKARADRIFKTMLQHYKRLGVIETGAYDLEEFLNTTKLIADDLNLTHETIPGTLEYMKKLLTGPWDDEFVVINPGETIALSHLKI